MSVSPKLLLVPAVVVLMMIFPGCSGDDNGGTGSTGKKPGDDMDLNYLMVRNALFGFDGAHVDRIRDLIQMYQTIAGRKSNSPPRFPAQAPVYHAVSEYWYVEHTDTTYYGIEIRQDSIQFLHSGEPVEVPDSALLTRIKCGSHWHLIDTATAKSRIAMAPGDTLLVTTLSFDMSGEPGEIAASGEVIIDLTATSDGLPPGIGSTCEWNCNLTATGDSLRMNLTDNNCPRSGDIDYSGIMVMVCPLPYPSYSNTWNARETFDNGSVSWHIENETYYWDTQSFCSWYLYF